MNYFNFKNALVKKSVVEDGYKYTVTVDGKDIAAGSIQGLINVLNKLYHMPKTDILDEIFGDDFQWCGIKPISYSAKIKSAIDIEKYGRRIKNYKGLCFEGLSEEGNTVTLKKYGTIDDITLQYAIEGIDTDWNYLTYDTPVNLAKGQKVYVRNVSDNDTFHINLVNSIQFITTGAIKLSGNIQSIAKNGQNFEKNNVAGCFAQLFSNDTNKPNNIVDASELKLPATTLVYRSYMNMFQGCSNLIAAPKLLPATTLAEACYNSMFKKCTSLTKAPELPATTLASSCYAFMFDSCKSLVSTPKLPATTLADYCYNGMFQSCKGLVEAPELPATVLASNCYNAMFLGCSNLIAAPELPVTTLATQCYQMMFRGCSNLNYIKVGFTDWNASSYATSNWLNSVAETGTFVKPAALEELRGISNIPEGWTIVNK